MERKVYSFSVKKLQDIELIEQLRAECDTKKQNFSAILLGLVKEALDARSRAASQSNQ